MSVMPAALNSHKAKIGDGQAGHSAKGNTLPRARAAQECVDSPRFSISARSHSGTAGFFCGGATASTGIMGAPTPSGPTHTGLKTKTERRGVSRLGFRCGRLLMCSANQTVA